MDFKELGKTLAGLGLPLLGGALLGPAGSAVGSMVASALGLKGTASAAEVTAAAISDPDALLKLRKLELDNTLELEKLANEATAAARAAESADIKVINETMRVESASEHWLQWSWRPLNGYSLAIGSLASVLGVIWLGWHAITTKDPGALNMIPQLVSGISMVLAVPGAVCGVTAWQRGKGNNAVLKTVEGNR